MTVTLIKQCDRCVTFYNEEWQKYHLLSVTVTITEKLHFSISVTSRTNVFMFFMISCENVFSVFKRDLFRAAALFAMLTE